MAIDQAHQQENERMKGDGGAVGLTEDPAALLRWMVAGPEVTRAVTQFEIQYISSPSEQEHLHHEQKHPFKELSTRKRKILLAS